MIELKAALLIADFEKFRAKAYRPMQGDPWTIGYGDTQKVKPEDTITSEDAAILLIKQVAKIDKSLWRLQLLLTDNQKIALISLIFNIGLFAFKRSKALKAFHARDMDKFRFEIEDPLRGFVRLSYGGKILGGLIKRRKIEMEIFFGERQL